MAHNFKAVMKTPICMTVIFLLLLNCGKPSKETDAASMQITDARDGQAYRIVKIGNLTWMAENLNYATGNSWCYDNDDTYCVKYGRLYNWNAALSACPIGWRLASDDDWDSLMTFVGGVKDKGGHLWAGISNVLKSKSGWNESGNGTDEYGFTALPGGHRLSDGSSIFDGDYGYWWSLPSSEGIALVWRYLVIGENVYSYWSGQDIALSVRCVRNDVHQ